nr:iron-containing alcohol dehydrogenase family protein [Niallia circulans]
MHIQPEDIVRSGPNQYICKEGILKELDSLLSPFQTPTIITGYKSFQAFSQYVDSIPTHWKIIQHGGYSSQQAVDQIIPSCTATDVIIGIGGGIILDTAKAVADTLNIEVILIPTVAGTCAASTPLSVIYSPEGAFERVAYHHRSSYLTLVDPAFLIHAPIDYLKSGIGDTLTKWYEAEAIIRNANDERSHSLFVQAALSQSIFIRDILLKESIEAVQNSASGLVTPSFTKTVEAVITLAGTVGGFGGRYGRMSGSHAIHNGLSFIEETHTILHGQKVAYGILVQLAIENRIDEIEALLPFYQQLGFPTNLADLNIVDNQTDALQKIATHAVNPKESLQLMGSYGADEVIAAMNVLESLTSIKQI